MSICLSTLSCVQDPTRQSGCSQRSGRVQALLSQLRHQLPWGRQTERILRTTHLIILFSAMIGCADTPPSGSPSSVLEPAIRWSSVVRTARWWVRDRTDPLRRWARGGLRTKWFVGAHEPSGRLRRPLRGCDAKPLVYRLRILAYRSGQCHRSRHPRTRGTTRHSARKFPYNYRDDIPVVQALTVEQARDAGQQCPDGYTCQVAPACVLTRKARPSASWSLTHRTPHRRW